MFKDKHFYFVFKEYQRKPVTNGGKDIKESNSEMVKRHET